MKDIDGPLITDYLITVICSHEFCQTSESLYFPSQFTLQGDQRRDEDCQPSTYDLLWICTSKNITDLHTPTPLSLMACNFELII